jgi:hypothetical protein
MNGLSDTLTIGLVLALVFGALFFYLYSRIGQIEKRVSLTENILLDLKMATENTMMAMASASLGQGSSHEEDLAPERIEPISGPQPVEKEEVEEIPDEDFYKQVLEQAPVKEESPVLARVEPNYESMTLKELKAEAKRKGVNVASNANKKEVIDALKRQGMTVSVLEPVPGSDGGLEEGFPVELGEAQ